MSSYLAKALKLDSSEPVLSGTNLLKVTAYAAVAGAGSYFMYKQVREHQAKLEKPVSLEEAIKGIELGYDEDDMLDEATTVKILDAQANSGEELHRVKADFNHARTLAMKQLE